MNKGLYSIPKNRTYDTKYHTLVESASYAITASFLTGLVESASYATTASYVDPNLINIDTGSFLVTASVSSNEITFTKGDGNPFTIVVATGSQSVLTAGSSIYSANAGTPISNVAGVYLGNGAATNASNASYSTFLGNNAGAQATNASYSIMMGDNVGYGAANAYESVLIGRGAGVFLNSPYSIFIGSLVGRNLSGANPLGSNNIIIGTNISLPNNRKDSINIAGIIFGTGSYNTIIGNPYTGSANGRIGINVVTPQYTLDVSGSGNFTNGLVVTGSLTATSFTGSLQGTSSWAVNAVTASHAPSYVLNSATSSMLSPYALSSALNSYVQNSVTASMLSPYALSSALNSYLLIASTSSMLQPYVLTSTTASMLSPYALSTALNSYVLTSVTSSMTVATASYVTASNVVGTVTSASYAANGGVTQITAGSGISINQSTGNVTITSTGIVSGSFVVTGSAVITGSMTVTSLTPNRALVTDTNDQLVSSTVTSTELGYLSGVTSNIQTQLDNSADLSIEAYQKLGSQVKAQTLGFNISNLSVSNVQIQGAAGSQIRLIPIYLQTPQTLNGVMWFQNALGVYTPNNENRIGLYTYSGGTATLVASSSNDGNMWSGSYTTAATYTTKSFSTPYNANPDFYYIAMLMSFAGTPTTVPTFFAGPNIVSTAVAARSLDFTNGAILTAARTTVTALPGSITVSTYNTLIQGNVWAAVY